MAVSYIRPAGGMSAADRETARQWMVEGHELLHGRVQGTIPTRGAAIITPGTTDQTIPAGLYLNGEQTIRGDAALVPENIRSGVSIFGVAGTVERPVALIDAFSDSNNWDRIVARVFALDISLITTTSFSTGNGGGVTIPFKRSAKVKIYIANARNLLGVSFTGVSSVVSGQQISVSAGSNMYLSWKNDGSVSYLLTEV